MSVNVGARVWSITTLLNLFAPVYSDLSGGQISSDAIEEPVSLPPSPLKTNQHTEGHKYTTLEKTDISPNFATTVDDACLAVPPKAAPTSSPSVVGSESVSRHSRTSETHNAIFGASDEELSEVSDDDYAEPSPNSPSIIVPGGTKGKTVFDSDDEHVPIASRTRNAKKAFIASPGSVDEKTVIRLSSRMRSVSSEQSQKSDTDKTKPPAFLTKRNSSSKSRKPNSLSISGFVTASTSKEPKAGRTTRSGLKSVTSLVPDFPISSTLLEHAKSVTGAPAPQAVKRVTRAGGRAHAKMFGERTKANAEPQILSGNIGKAGYHNEDTFELVDIQISSPEKFIKGTDCCNGLVCCFIDEMSSL
jgi:hypothetical protein